MAVALFVGALSVDVYLRMAPPQRFHRARPDPVRDGPPPSSGTSAHGPAASRDNEGRYGASGAPTEPSKASAVPASQGPSAGSKGEPKAGPAVLARQGEMASALLAARETIFLPEDSGVDPTGRSVRAGLSLLRTSLRDRSEQLSRLGQPPWSSSRFQAFAAVLPHHSFFVFGSDFAMTASPADSVQWYRREWDLPPAPGTDDGEAERRLSDFYVQRKETLVRIVARVERLSAALSPEPENSTFILVDGNLAIVRHADSPQLMDAVDRFHARLREAERTAVEEAK